MSKPLLLTWTLDEWPLARRWADYVGFPESARTALFYAWWGPKSSKLSIFERIDEPDLDEAVTDAGLWVAQLGWAALAHHGDVHQRWQAPHTVVGQPIRFLAGPHFGDHDARGEFGFHATATFDGARSVVESDGFEVWKVAELLKPTKPRELEARIDWMEEETAEPIRALFRGDTDELDFAYLDGLLALPSAWSDLDRRVLTAAESRGTTGRDVMATLTGSSTLVDEAGIAERQLAEWGFSSALSVSGEGACHPEHGRASAYAALSATADMDRFITGLEAHEEPDIAFVDAVHLLAYFAPKSSLCGLFLERIDTVIARSPDPDATAEMIADDPELSDLLDALRSSD